MKAFNRRGHCNKDLKTTENSETSRAGHEQYGEWVEGEYVRK